MRPQWQQTQVEDSQGIQTEEMKAKFDQTDLNSCENSLRVYRDWKGVIDTAFDEGRMESTVEIAKAMKRKGLSATDISEMTGLSEDEVNSM